MNAEARSVESTHRQSRHRDDGRGLRQHLGDYCDVLCPRCDHRGRVRYESLENSEVIARFACSNCALALCSSPGSVFSGSIEPDAPWYGRIRLSGRRICGYCGARWLRREFDLVPSASRPISFETIVACPVCGNQYPLSLAASRLHDEEIGSEPVFGLRLVHSEEALPGKAVWAYNLAHLDEIKRFVGAQLRECSLVSNSTYISRLPAWLKSARHRKKVLAAIARIERNDSAHRQRFGNAKG